MKFEFEINNEDLFEYDNWNEEEVPVDFKELLRKNVVESVSNKMIDSQLYDDWKNGINDEIKKILKENRDEIINRVVNQVATLIAAKKELVAITPKASELTRIDKENEQYFIGLIDKAIAKRFK
jgi:hypothetical protein